MNKKIAIRVNGHTVEADVEPRMQLADFLREHLLLTGTHVGCEHGVCGACTVEIDGAPARSCISYAVACDGADVRTIEGLQDDAVMAELREAFSAHHALQCGYCTPGMLVTARDIVLRLPNADEARIRMELAGNLCRCTGYVGIVRAIQSVLGKRATADVPKGRAGEAVSIVREPTFIAPAAVASHAAPSRGGVTVDGARSVTAVVTPVSSGTPQTTLRQSFLVTYPRDVVWDFFNRLDEVAACLPGTMVTATPTPEQIDARIRVRVGPIVAEFQGAATVVRDPSAYSGVIHGSARDTRSSSATRGEIRYALSAESDTTTRVDVDIGFTLTGPLAQFGRSSIVHDIARRMTDAFVQNLEIRLEQLETGAPEGKSAAARTRELDAGSLFFSIARARITRFWRFLTGR